jgi:uncharacterized membrane protein YeaQ/YmgE (transglycosylase-associated protein family)
MNMDLVSLLIFLAIGAAAGFLAGKIMKGSDFGLLNNMIIGVIGAFIGGFVFSLLGISAGGLIGSLITALAGAMILLYIAPMIKKALK